MGLIDKKRSQRDSWMYRFEEHRQEHEEDSEVEIDPEKEEAEIMRRRRMVGRAPSESDEK